MAQDEASQVKEIIQSPFFYFGLIVKLILILSLSPVAVTDLFGPFLANSLVSGSLDPWSSWLSNSGSSLAFPYGYSMWLTFLPLSMLGDMLGIPIEYCYSFTLLICDFALLSALCQILVGRQRLVLFAYWLSPVVVLASYGLGLNDVIPALYLIFGILFLKSGRVKFSGIFVALAISAKLSMLVGLPFIILYLYNNKSLRKLIYDFGIGFFAVFLIFGLPFLASNSATSMLFKNPEMSEFLGLSFEVSRGVSIYFLPILFAAILYFVWRARRLNFDLFMAIVGIVFLLIVILMPAAPGWFVWTIPFLVFYQSISGRTSVLIIAVFSSFFVVSTLLKQKFHIADWSILDLSTSFGKIDFLRSDQVISLIDTGVFALGIVLVIRMWRESIAENEFFRQSRKPFVVGIAGDSGAGKDTFVDALSDLFGSHSSAMLSGDDYHLWDRHKPMWQVMTHLNPVANDLESFSGALFSLADGKQIKTRYYNHTTGKMSKYVKTNSNDFIFASGLHALYLPQLRDCYNLKIYLDIDEDLRRYFKITRDVGIRGHSLEQVLNSIEGREADSERFIRPQKMYADLVLSLRPIRPDTLKSSNLDISRHLKLIATTRNGLSELTLNRVLVGLCGLHVDVMVSSDGSEVNMTIEGDISKEDIAMAANIICPDLVQFFDINPKWCDGVLGVMQLITISHINQIFTKRFIK
jgi:uridine kinase